MVEGSYKCRSQLNARTQKASKDIGDLATNLLVQTRKLNRVNVIYSHYYRQNYNRYKAKNNYCMLTLQGVDNNS